MIRDPSDGSVRDDPVEFPDWDRKLEAKFPDGVPVQSTPLLDKLASGLRQPTRTDAQIRLEQSREWLKDYHAKHGAPHADGGNDGKEHSAGGDSSGQNARSTVE